jgi:hypothetical protein
MVLYAYMRVFVYSRFVENPPICSWETNPPFLRWFCHNKRGEKHSSKISFQMKWLSHGYGNGGVVDILMVDAYSGMELCTPILLGEASKKIWVTNHF